MNRRSDACMKMPGVAGIIMPIVAFACIFLAAAYYPPFSWTENALSDLGVMEGLASILFNYGLIVSGILALIFASGLLRLMSDRKMGKAGVSLFIFDALALIAIGVFNENSEPMHSCASVAFFALMPLSMLFLTTAFLMRGELGMGLFTLATALAAAAVWAIQWTIGFGRGVAIPETLSAVSVSIWSMVLSLKMIKQTSRTDVQ